jgi:SepF-like predicted cell division protein (DUF552 family)
VIGGCAVLMISAVVIAKLTNVPLTEADLESLKNFQSTLSAESAKHGFNNSMAIVESGKHQVLITPDRIKQL